jgi:hypothetical protein
VGGVLTATRGGSGDAACRGIIDPFADRDEGEDDELTSEDTAVIAEEAQRTAEAEAERGQDEADQAKRVAADCDRVSDARPRMRRSSTAGNLPARWASEIPGRCRSRSSA